MTIDFRSVEHCTPIIDILRRAVRSFRTQFDHCDEKVQHCGQNQALGVRPMEGDFGQNAVLSRHGGQIEL